MFFSVAIRVCACVCMRCARAHSSMNLFYLMNMQCWLGCASPYMLLIVNTPMEKNKTKNWSVLSSLNTGNLCLQMQNQIVVALRQKKLDHFQNNDINLWRYIDVDMLMLPYSTLSCRYITVLVSNGFFLLFSVAVLVLLAHLKVHIHTTVIFVPLTSRSTPNVQIPRSTNEK